MDGNDTSPHSHALRLGRYSIPGQVYLITAVTADRRAIFHDLYCGRILINVIQAYQPSARTLCFVIMPDHLHWLMSLDGQKSLPQVVGGVKAIAARRINRYLRRQGPLWQDGFHDRAIRREEDIRAIARYVVANPLRAGLVDRIGDYPLWDAVWL